jgi:hypothetical protein
MMSAAGRVCRTIADGLLFGFTFALGWFFAVLLIGAAVA